MVSRTTYLLQAGARLVVLMKASEEKKIVFPDDRGNPFLTHIFLTFHQLDGRQAARTRDGQLFVLCLIHFLLPLFIPCAQSTDIIMNIIVNHRISSGWWYRDVKAWL